MEQLVPICVCTRYFELTLLSCRVGPLIIIPHPSTIQVVLDHAQHHIQMCLPCGYLQD